jgi:lipopolysaccharide export LptBFGC system permease protein LptF
VFRTIDRHVLSQWLTILGLVTGATFGLLMLQAVYDVVPELLEYGASSGVMLLYFAVLAPSFLSLVLPISVLVSLLYALGQMHRHNEITALRASGVGVFRLTRWIWIAVAGFSALLFYLNGSVIPWSVEESRVMRENLKFNHLVKTTGSSDEVGVVRNVTWDNRAAGRLWMISGFSRYSHRASGLCVSLLDDARREVRRIVAEEATWDEYRQRWEMFRGWEMVFDPETGRLVRPIPFERNSYAELSDDPEWMIMLEKRAKHLSFFELDRIMRSPESAGNPRLPQYAVRYHALLAGTFSCIIVAGLAVPFAVSGVRVNPAVGVSKSISLFAVFWLLARAGELLGAEGTFDPILAAWTPYAVMSAIAVVFMARLR